MNILIEINQYLIDRKAKKIDFDYLERAAHFKKLLKVIVNSTENNTEAELRVVVAEGIEKFKSFAHSNQYAKLLEKVCPNERSRIMPSAIKEYKAEAARLLSELNSKQEKRLGDELNSKNANPSFFENKDNTVKAKANSNNVHDNSIPIYADNSVLGKKKKNITEILQDFLALIDTKYCKLIVLSKSVDKVPYIGESRYKAIDVSDISASKDFVGELEKGNLRVTTTTNSVFSGEKGINMLAALLPKLKAVTSVQELLVCIHKSGCMSGSKFPEVVAPFIMELYNLGLKAQHAISTSAQMELKDLSETSAQFINVKDAFKKFEPKKDITDLAKLICKEAAGDLNGECSVSKIFSDAFPNQIEENKGQYCSVVASPPQR